ncbi:hypothetical protein BOS5A_200176 [Bosea sp. EC-HK365B]|nr:hypothetical protein BOS5A_200176 [Bosea sp. EC-HK365B]
MPQRGVAETTRESGTGATAPR